MQKIFYLLLIITKLSPHPENKILMTFVPFIYFCHIGFQIDEIIFNLNFQ